MTAAAQAQTLLLSFQRNVRCCTGLGTHMPSLPQRRRWMQRFNPGVNWPNLPITRGAKGSILQGGEGPMGLRLIVCARPRWSAGCWQGAGKAEETSPLLATHDRICFFSFAVVEGKGPSLRWPVAGGGKGSLPSPMTSTAWSAKPLPPTPAGAAVTPGSRGRVRGPHALS